MVGLLPSVFCLYAALPGPTVVGLFPSVFCLDGSAAPAAETKPTTANIARPEPSVFLMVCMMQFLFGIEHDCSSRATVLRSTSGRRCETLHRESSFLHLGFRQAFQRFAI